MFSLVFIWWFDLVVEYLESCHIIYVRYALYYIVVVLVTYSYTIIEAS
jgi:hypothetical protein